MNVLMCYVIVGLCLIVAVSLFSEKHIFLGILPIIFGICVMINMANEIGWGKLLLPVIIIVSIIVLAYLIQFIWIMTRPKPVETKNKPVETKNSVEASSNKEFYRVETSNKEVQTAKRVYTEEDSEKFAVMLTDFLLKKYPSSFLYYNSPFASEQVQLIISEMGLEGQFSEDEICDIAAPYEIIYDSRTEYLEIILEDINSEFRTSHTGDLVKTFLPDIFGLDIETMAKVLAKVNDRLKLELLESESADKDFIERYEHSIRVDIQKILTDRNKESQNED